MKKENNALRDKLFRQMQEKAKRKEASKAPLYIYLTKREWAKNWVEGGEIPLSMTTKYKTEEERSGTFTPDEDVHRHIDGMPYEAFEKFFYPAEPDVTNVEFKGGTFRDGDKTYKLNKFSLQHSPALVLCLSTERSKDLAVKLGDKETCIEITDIEKLIAVIDKQLKVVGESGLCRYTKTMNRNHFLKSTEDSWQHEYRIIWNVDKETVVRLPAGLCKEVTL